MWLWIFDSLDRAEICQKSKEKPDFATFVITPPPDFAHFQIFPKWREAACRSNGNAERSESLTIDRPVSTMSRSMKLLRCSQAGLDG